MVSKGSYIKNRSAIYLIAVMTGLVLFIFLLITKYNESDNGLPGEIMEKLYFSSPKESISLISNLLREEDLLTLTSYFELENTDIPIDDFLSGKYFMGEIDGQKPVGLFKYVKPFSPGFKFSHLEELENEFTRVHLTLEIDQGEGMVLRSIHSFDLIRSEKGFRILP